MQIIEYSHNSVRTCIINMFDDRRKSKTTNLKIAVQNIKGAYILFLYINKIWTDGYARK